jgi:HSP20 family protein
MWRWIDPIEELRRMQEKMERFLGEMERRRGLLSGELIDFPVDVIDEDEKIKVIAELPGFNKEGIEITIENGFLVIKAEREEEKKEIGRDYLVQERKYGELKRRVSLPAEVKVDSIKATYNNGILEVILPKAEVTKKKKIDIE